MMPSRPRSKSSSALHHNLNKVSRQSWDTFQSISPDQHHSRISSTGMRVNNIKRITDMPRRRSRAHLGTARRRGRHCGSGPAFPAGASWPLPTTSLTASLQFQCKHLFGFRKHGHTCMRSQVQRPAASALHCAHCEVCQQQPGHEPAPASMPQPESTRCFRRVLPASSRARPSIAHRRSCMLDHDSCTSTTLIFSKHQSSGCCIQGRQRPSGRAF